MDAEKRYQLELLIGRRERYRNGLTVAQDNIKGAQNLISFWTPKVVEFERLVAELDREIRATGFHDVGHAKGELAKEGV